METRSNYVLVGAVTVALLVGLLLFFVWLAGLSNVATKCYDIYFPAVGGINKGTNVSFSGVPVGQVSKIGLLPNRPEFVWVRISVDEQTPVLEGTTAEIHSVSLAGANEIQLNGAQRGRAPITRVGPQGCPVIPASTSGLSALLNSAPELIARIQRLTERLTELFSDKNQNAISDILENLDHTTKVLADRAPELGGCDRRCANRSAQCRHCRPACHDPDRQHQPPRDRGRQAGGAGPEEGNRLDPTGHRQSRRDDLRRSAGRAEFDQVDAARGQPAGARPA